MTRTYRVSSTLALPVLVGVLPVALVVVRCGSVDTQRYNKTLKELRTFQKRCTTRSTARSRCDGVAQLRKENCSPSSRRSGRTCAVASSSIILQCHKCSWDIVVFGSGNKIKLSERKESDCRWKEEDRNYVLWDCPFVYG
ncbi:hypothetical protein EVAR_95243_1 [Eumeta japonica]|uniref:Uncharacterized protein n=1 Tax=Eumeta variegata TaxID=151549 RepID=A0A4C1UL91_EUMVA|nr:hypothetical protein EVAR_95243_1 [Eumeta japonica]